MICDKILKLSGSGYGSSWSIYLDLEKITEAAGVKRKVSYIHTTTGRMISETVCDLPLTQARKLVQLILRYAEEDEIKQIDEIFSKNQKLYTIWGQYVKRVF